MPAHNYAHNYDVAINRMFLKKKKILLVQF